jgi:hypothetical protein
MLEVNEIFLIRFSLVLLLLLLAAVCYSYWRSKEARLFCASAQAKNKLGDYAGAMPIAPKLLGLILTTRILSLFVARR